MTKFNTKFVPSIIHSPLLKFNQDAVNRVQTFIVKYSEVAIQFMQSAHRFTMYIKVNAYTIQSNSSRKQSRQSCSQQS